MLLQDPESIRSTIGATALRNFTADIQKLMNELNSVTNAEDCCNYRYQMLDTYCASRVIICSKRFMKIYILVV